MKQLISIVVPCRNEEKYITKCLASILRFKLPENVDVEVLVMDGMSEDNTRDLVNAMSVKHPEIRLHDNEKQLQSPALNKAIRLAKGGHILRLDAHAEYPEDYLSNCIQTANETGADNVGGVVITLKGGDTYAAALVQALTTHKFGVGDSSFRTEMKQGEADTVPFGFFRKDIFDKVGYFDERLLRAQDYEFNRRILANGGTIWLNSEIYSKYYNQPTLRKFYHKQFYKEAPYNVYLWYLAPYAFAVRHAITGVFTAGILVGAILAIFFSWIAWLYLGVFGLYFVLAFLSAAQQARRFKDIRHFFLLPFCFFGFHFVHGLGILVGALRVITGTAPVQGKPEPWPGAGRFRAFPAQ